MIQKIYTTFISFAFAALTLSSCSDWLDLYPSDEIKEEYLFSSGDGFRTATNGIYRKMATFDLYGSIDSLIILEDPELNHRFNGSNPAYCDERFEELGKLTL